ncbi:MAG: LysR family transcriptional regulator [Bacteriovoracales bacterium]|nr:LysR family transcriptional regulator [Bacteriovoracales bacterium]
MIGPQSPLSVEYRYLKAFVLTAKHSSFSKAAMELKVAQSAISRQIKLLERSLRQELIIRSSKKVVLTERGKELFFAVQGLEDNVKNIFGQESKRTIRIGVLQGLLENWSQRIFETYYGAHENNLFIRVAAPSKLKAMLQEGRLDLAFTNENIQGELISSLKLFDETLVLISKEKVCMETIDRYRWIIYGDDDNLVQTYTKRSRDIIEVNDMFTIVHLVRAGVGIAVVPSHILSDLQGLVVQKFERSQKSEIYLAVLNFKSTPSYLEEFIQIVMDRRRYVEDQGFH